MGVTPFKKKRVFELLADALEVRIREESWTGLIPSGRDLAHSHGVSLPTVQKAIALLLDRKILVGRGGNRRPGVAAEAKPRKLSPNARRLLVFSEQSLKRMRPPFSVALQLLQEQTKERGYACTILDVSDAEGVALRKRVNAAVTRYDPSHCITIQPSKVTDAVLARTSLKQGCLYGALRSKRVQRFGHHYGPLLSRAVQELATFGHRHCFVPFLGRKLKPDDSVFAACREAQEQGFTVEVKHCRDSATHACMEQCLDSARRRGATAIVFPQWGDFLYAITYFAKKGLEIPRDISVVVLICHEEAREFAPPLAGHMVYSPEALSAQFMHWLEHDAIDHGILHRSLAQGWERAGSIGPAPVER
jgi:DNA-binding LacI/PurR family transcriptional regulator